MTVRNIHLHGDLGKFGELHVFNADNLQHLYAGLKARDPKLDYYLRTNKVKVIGGVGDNIDRDFGEGLNFGAATDIHVVPSTEGAFFIPAIYAAYGLWAAVAAVAVEVTIAYVALKMAAKMQTNGNGPGQRSNIFSGPVNSTAQGGPIPIIYGKKVLVGSTIISSALQYNNVGINQSPTNNALPVITGLPEEGYDLSTSTGAWAGPSLVYSYQWYNADPASEYGPMGTPSEISGATSSTYTLQSTDVGKMVMVAVTASNPQGNASATSAAIGPVTGIYNVGFI